jgi:hypothetical protein
MSLHMELNLFRLCGVGRLSISICKKLFEITPDTIGNMSGITISHQTDAPTDMGTSARAHVIGTPSLYSG